MPMIYLKELEHENRRFKHMYVEERLKAEIVEEVEKMLAISQPREMSRWAVTEWLAKVERVRDI